MTAGPSGVQCAGAAGLGIACGAPAGQALCAPAAAHGLTAAGPSGVQCAGAAGLGLACGAPAAPAGQALCAPAAVTAAGCGRTCEGPAVLRRGRSSALPWRSPELLSATGEQASARVRGGSSAIPRAGILPGLVERGTSRHGCACGACASGRAASSRSPIATATAACTATATAVLHPSSTSPLGGSAVGASGNHIADCDMWPGHSMTLSMPGQYRVGGSSWEA
mmetsp:Transcript_78615/g.230675  ORF Transcript_78615/g.230675 Transcript_78615/m.230675 type:complete len:223 (-) Transcript_78615:560-1228(-)